MADKKEEDVNDILNKYERKLKEVSGQNVDDYEPSPGFSKEYESFRDEALTTQTSTYERLCNISEQILKINPSKKDYKNLEESIEVAHLQITPTGAYSFAILFTIFLSITGIFLFGVIFYLSDPVGLDLTKDISLGLWLLPLLFILGAVFFLIPVSNIPVRKAEKWRLEASNEMVLCVLYIVMYMRHTANLEMAIKFAADHVGNPLALDLRKIFWDVESGKYETIKQSLDSYLERWRDHNLEFIESFHLIESSLYESSDDRRVNILEKALEIILNGTYEKMMHYAHDLGNPITMLNMLGVVLPILGLVMFPLLGSFMGGLVRWYHLAILYNIILPIVVYSLGSSILSKRPTGYGSGSDLIEQNPELKKYTTIHFLGTEINPLFISILIGGIFCIIGFMPIMLHLLGTPDFQIMDGIYFLDYRGANGLECEAGNPCYGPFGMGALVLSMFIPFGLAIAIGFYYSVRTKKLIKIRNETKKLEQEFAGALFQFGNRVGDGIPAEAAFGEVAETMQNTPTGNFFRRVNENITMGGMSISKAIFNTKNGAIWDYPSSLIESSMKVLIESAQKGPQIVAKCMMSISGYVARIKEINERLNDLLAETISSMKSQIAFLTPVIAGIVVAIGTMIVTIITLLNKQFSSFSAGSTEGSPFGAGAFSAISNLFRIQDIIPVYWFQLIVGIYVVEVIILLTYLASGVENGVDKIVEGYSLSKNLYRSVFFYTAIGLVASITFIFLIKVMLPVFAT